MYVAILAQAMHVISLVFSSVSTCKATCSKNTLGYCTFHVSTHVSIETAQVHE